MTIHANMPLPPKRQPTRKKVWATVKPEAAMPKSLRYHISTHREPSNRSLCWEWSVGSVQTSKRNKEAEQDEAQSASVIRFSVVAACAATSSAGAPSPWIGASSSSAFSPSWPRPHPPSRRACASSSSRARPWREWPSPQPCEPSSVPSC